VTQIFAHRGLHQRVPENTVTSFLEAKAVGVQGVELDVRRTSDGALVVHHDEAVEGVGLIATAKCRDLPSHVASLAEALGACEGLIVNVEIKNSPTEQGYDSSGSLASQVVAAIGELGQVDDVIISCFDLATCQAVRQFDAAIRVGWLLEFARDTREAIATVHALGLDAVHPFFLRVDEVSMAMAHELGIAVNTWTVNEPRDIAAMIELGVDTIITDEPVVALEVLANGRT